MSEHRGVWRGRRMDSTEWVEGLLEYRNNDGSAAKIYIEKDFEAFWVDAPTLGECAGFTDKNGKLAFEGDLVKDDSNDAIGVIRYGEYRQPFNDDKFTKHIGFYVDWLEENDRAFLRVDLGYWLPLVKIIGNIHDNKE